MSFTFNISAFILLCLIILFLGLLIRFKVFIFKILFFLFGAILLIMMLPQMLEFISSLI